MTGIFVRVKRDGKWGNCEIEYLTPDELRVFFAEADQERILRFFAAVTSWMREHIIEDADMDA